jgi:hypothetical protein
MKEDLNVECMASLAAQKHLKAFLEPSKTTREHTCKWCFSSVILPSQTCLYSRGWCNHAATITVDKALRGAPARKRNSIFKTATLLATQLLQSCRNAKNEPKLTFDPTLVRAAAMAQICKHRKSSQERSK